MKATAIIYTSNTGFTRRYAQLLGEATGLPVHNLSAAGKAVPRGASIVYLGWLMAGSVKGVKKAIGRWTVTALCAVGMGSDGEKQLEGLGAKCGLAATVPLFYLRGGYAPEKLKGLYKVMMMPMGAIVKKAGAGNAETDPQAAEMLTAFTQGGDWVSQEQLVPIIEYLKS